MENEILDSDLRNLDGEVEVQRIISVDKFIILSVLSFGLYELWWTYKAWRFYQKKEQTDIVPVARAIFSVFYLYSLYDKILRSAESVGYSHTYSPGLLYGGFFIGCFADFLPDPYWLISILSFWFFVPSFKALNFVKQNSEDIVSELQEDYNGRQILIIVLGLIFWIAVIIGLNVD